MRSLAHKDPGKPDEDLLEQTRHLFADPIPEMEVPELRWCWSITVSGNRPDVVMQGRAPTLDLAKARFLSNWQKCRGNQLPDIARIGRPRHSNRLSIPDSVWSTDGPDGG
jgi:hypothetical protein